MCARAGVLAVLLCLAASRVAAVELLIVHYELFEDTSPRLLATLADSVRNVRAAGGLALVLNAAGANVTGGVATDVHAVGVTAVAELGLVPLLTHADGATLAANLRLPAPLRASVQPSLTLQLPGDAGRIGVIGVVPADLNAAAAGGAVTDAVAAVQQEASRLRRDGVGTLLALGGLGSAEALQLAHQVPELDALVVPGGYRERAVYPQTVSRASGGALPLLEAPLVTAAGYLGLVTLTLAPGGRVAGWHGRVMPLRLPPPPPPPAVDPPRRAPGGRGSFCAPVAGEIGETLSELDGRRASCSRRECSLGSALADALLLSAVLPTASAWSEVSLALLTAGSLSGSLPRCAVSEADLAAATAADSTAVALSIAGTYLRQALEQSAAGHGSTAFLQMAGVRVVYDLSRPAGSRVRQLKVLCSECEAPRYVDVRGDRLYRLVTNSRLAGGGDGYDVIAIHGKFVADSHRTERDIYREYLRTRSPVPPPTGGRIFFMGEYGPVSELSESEAAEQLAGGSAADNSEPGAEVVSADTPLTSPAPSDAAGQTDTPSATTEPSLGVTAYDLFYSSALWTLGGFATLGMMIMAIF